MQYVYLKRPKYLLNSQANSSVQFQTEVVSQVFEWVAHILRQVDIRGTCISGM